MKSQTAIALSAAALAVTALSAPSAAAPAPLGGILINEVDSDTVSSDELEFIELWDGGVGSASLDGLVVVFFNGSSDTSYNAIDLDGFSTDANGYFLLGNASVVPAPGITFANNGLQNGADAVALYVGDDTDWPNGTAATTTGLVDAVVYDTNDGDDAGLLAALGLATQYNEDENGNKDFDSVQRCPSGGSWGTGLATPGTQCQLTTDVIINEVDSDTESTDELEFVELWDGGAGNTALDGLVVVFFNGSSDTSYNAFDLDGFSTDANGYFLLGNASLVPAPAITFANNGLQNGADAVGLYFGDDTDWPNGTAATDTNLVDAVVYDTNDGDDAGLLAALGQATQYNEDENGNKDFDSIQRCPNGADFGTGLATPSAECDQSASFETYCVSFPNSFIVSGAQMGSTGTGSITDNDTVLVCTDLPDTIGLFYMASDQAFNAPFGNGVMCVAAPVFRLPQAVTIVGNQASRPLDFLGATAENQIVSGQNWNFQFWYRDPGQGANFNTSNGLSITFAP